MHSGLARQVSSLLTNHLARATECCGNQAAGNEALQDVLSLLNDLSRCVCLPLPASLIHVCEEGSRLQVLKKKEKLHFLCVCLCVCSRSHIGKAILSQPACVSKLLSLLLDQRPSPKLVLIILQLCRAALPLMSVDDCRNVALPPWSYSMHALDAEQADSADPASRIASLLLAKLADYVVPGKLPALPSRCTEPSSHHTPPRPARPPPRQAAPGWPSCPVGSTHMPAPSILPLQAARPCCPRARRSPIPA